MHELSLAQSIIDLVHQHVAEGERSQVASVRMKVGTMAGVVVESLSFSFSALTAGSALERAQLQVESIPYRIQCRLCGALSENDWGSTTCGECASVETTIVSGTELQVVDIELLDQPQVAV
jgi:hydrogenase nickel incorporation protein HypA/HybF